MKFSNTKVGEHLSYTSYVEVLSKNATNGEMEVKDSNGKTFIIRGKSLIEGTMNSAAQYTTEKEVNQVQLVEALLNAKDAVFTVRFTKADGEKRTLTGHLIGTENHMGRSNVVDLEVTSGNNMRQVDHRTLEYVILKGVKYVKK